MPFPNSKNVSNRLFLYRRSGTRWQQVCQGTEFISASELEPGANSTSTASYSFICNRNITCTMTVRYYLVNENVVTRTVRFAREVVALTAVYLRGVAVATVSYLQDLTVLLFFPIRNLFLPGDQFEQSDEADRDDSNASSEQDQQVEPQDQQVEPQDQQVDVQAEGQPGDRPDYSTGDPSDADLR